MPIPKIDQNNAPVTEARIAEFEKELELSLPDQYRQFLLEHNGGRPEPESFCTDQRWGGSQLDFFHGLDTTKRYKNLESRVYACDFVGEDGDMDDLLPIGSDAGGNEVAIGVGEANRGQIFFYAHDEPGGAKNTWKIADSFQEFLESFREPAPLSEADLKMLEELNPPLPGAE